MIRLALILAALVPLILASEPAMAKKKKQKPLQIYEAFVTYDDALCEGKHTVTMVGQRMNRSSSPVVTLGAAGALELCSDPTEQMIVATLPPGIQSGDYRLRVSAGKKSSAKDSMDLTIPGPLSPSGPGSDVTVLEARVAALEVALDQQFAVPNVTGTYSGSMSVSCPDLGEFKTYSLSLSLDSQSGNQLAGSAELSTGNIRQEGSFDGTVTPGGVFHGAFDVDIFVGGSIVNRDSGMFVASIDDGSVAIETISPTCVGTGSAS